MANLLSEVYKLNNKIIKIIEQLIQCKYHI